MGRYNKIASHEIQHLINEVKNMDDEELRVIHGITIEEDGQVFDPTYNKTFDGIAEWATFVVDESVNDIDEYSRSEDDYDYY